MRKNLLSSSKLYSESHFRTDSGVGPDGFRPSNLSNKDLQTETNFKRIQLYEFANDLL
jgi:hypothetical protein